MYCYFFLTVSCLRILNKIDNWKFLQVLHIERLFERLCAKKAFEFGQSMGGARPKTSVKIDQKLYKCAFLTRGVEIYGNQ